MEKDFSGQVLIECPNTIFCLYVCSEEELSRIDIFMNNIRSMKSIGLNDIYNWCNRQGIAYDTRFNFHKDFSAGRTLYAFINYWKQKIKYQWHLLPV